jgi:hypothetical protein
VVYHKLVTVDAEVRYEIVNYVSCESGNQEIYDTLSFFLYVKDGRSTLIMSMFGSDWH